MVQLYLESARSATRLRRSLATTNRTTVPGIVVFLELFGVGASATIGQLCLTKAFTLGVPSRVAVVGLSQVGFALLFEVILESRHYDRSSLLGVALVLAPTAILLLRRQESEPTL